MLRNRLFKTLGVFVMLVVLVSGINYLLSITATRAEAAPTCGMFTFNTTGLSASEVYYAQRFMVQEPCSALPVSGVSASGLDCAWQVFSAEWDSHNLSASEVYYARKAQRFMSCEATNGIAGLAQ